MVGNTTNNCLEVFNDIAPVHEIKTRSNHKPWVTADLRRLIDYREKLYRRIRYSNSPSLTSAYRSVRSEITNKLGTAKSAYFKSRLDNASSIKSKWCELRKMGIGTNKLPSPLDLFHPDTLNAHFVAISNKHPPLTDNDVKAACETPCDIPTSCFNFQLVTPTCVERALSSLNSSGVGVDGITSNMLKLSTPAIIPTITDIINASLSDGSFPDPWKYSAIVPLSKNLTPLSPSDTGPIAQLPEMSKILERIVYDQFITYLNENKLLDQYQSAYKPGHSTQTALLGILNDVRIAIENRMITILVSFDFSKAFDTIPHNKLLLKLRKIGCSELVVRWFASYLSNRKQAVRKADGTHSEWLEVNAGVPQGSVLGPLLFSIYINDLCNNITFSKRMLYADDLQIYIHCLPTHIADGVYRLNADASAVSNWATSNGLNLNAKKTTAIILGSQQYVADVNRAIDLNTIPSIIVGDTPINYVSTIKNLGVYITSTLEWRSHIKSICAKAHRTLFMLRKCKHSLTRNLRKYLVETLILPCFDYCCAVYHDLYDCENHMLHKALNACTRFVYGNIPFMSHVTPYTIALGWFSVVKRREYFISCLAFSVLKNKSPDYLARHFRLTIDEEIRRSNRRPQQTFLYAPRRTAALYQTFHYTASKIINTLPSSIDFDNLPKKSFKDLLRTHLLSTDKIEWVDRANNTGLQLIPPALTDILSFN